MQALLEHYAPSELLLGVLTGAGALIEGLSFVAAVAVGVVATHTGKWLDQYGVRPVS